VIDCERNRRGGIVIEAAKDRSRERHALHSSQPSARPHRLERNTDL